MITEIFSIIIPLATAILGYLASHLTRSGRDRERAGADKAIKDNYEERITALNTLVSTYQEIEQRQASRISDLNRSLDDKTARMRETEDRIYATERENTRLAEENGQLKTDLANHRCVIRLCGARDPENNHTKAAKAAGTAVYPSATAAPQNKARTPE